MGIKATGVPVWKEPLWLWTVWGVLLPVLFLPFQEGLTYMYDTWMGKDEYSHAPIIPLISLFLIWQRKDTLEKIQFNGSLVGLMVVIAGAAIYLVGELATLYVIIQYAFVITLIGLFFTMTGWRAFKHILLPLFILFLMIPLPNFIYNNLSSKLQLISSQIGVWFIRLFDITVFLEGNVIDLGNYQLQVVEACNGLRYLFPLMALGFIMAYFYKSSMWKRVLVFLSSIPVTVLMNSIRIGIIGVTVEYWGQEMAQGFLHDFEGWFVFMVCAAILLAEMWILTRIGKESRSFREVFGLEFPDPTPEDAVVQKRKLPPVFIVSCLVIAGLGVSSQFLSQREEIIPARTIFAEFPMQINGWEGRRDSLEQQYIDALKFEDYILANYQSPDLEMVNFYVAYYDSQRKGESVHSPRSCIPGSGLRIDSLESVEIPDVKIAGSILRVNRAVIQEGDTTSLVYYWFLQRGRSITNEYMVKWWLFWDAMTKNRSDGSLVRLTVRVQNGKTPEQYDEVLSGFAAEVAPFISDYIPD